jgi:uncharacterized UBP type Zn finger protein
MAAQLHNNSRDLSLVGGISKFGKDSSTLKNTNVMKDVLTCLQKRHSTMNFYEQNDASEFILHVFEEIEKECYRIVTKDDISILLGHAELPNNIVGAYKKKTNVLDFPPDMKRLECVIRKRILHRFFNKFSDIMLLCTSVHVSQIRCGCKHMHHNYEFSNVVHLDVNKNNSIKECFEDLLKSQYFNKEDIDTPHLVEWTCDVCNSKQVSKKTQAFWKFGKVLILFLNRFDMNRNGYPVKNNRPVSIPEILDINPYIISERTYPRSDTTYKLVSVGCHVGVLKGGHYYSVLKKKISNNTSTEWCIIDDDVLVHKKERSQLENHYANACFCVYVS